MNLLLPHGFLKGSPFNDLKKTERWAILLAMFEADELGIVTIDREIFEIQSGVPIAVFDSAIKKLGDLVLIDGEHHWFCEALHEQYGRNPQSMARNTMFPTLIKKLARSNYPASIVSEVLVRYPVFKDSYTQLVTHGIKPVKYTTPKAPRKSKSPPLNGSRHHATESALAEMEEVEF